MPTIGFTEILIILLIAMILFGPSAFPKIGKSIGEGLKEFKKAQRGEDLENSNINK